MKGAIAEKGLHIFNMPEKERCGYYPIPKAGFRIETDPETHNLTSHWYSTKNKKLPSDIVNKIYTDPQKKQLVMTKQGMFR